MDNLDKKLAEAKPLLMQFYSPACPKCAKAMPVADALKEELGDKFNLVQVNVETEPQIMSKYDVRTHPFWLLFKDGQIVWRAGGVVPLEELRDMVKRFI